MVLVDGLDQLRKLESLQQLRKMYLIHWEKKQTIQLSSPLNSNSPLTHNTNPMTKNACYKNGIKDPV